MFDTYKPSGRFSLSFVAWLLLGSILVSALAYIYQMGLTWIPWIYASFLLTFGFGQAIGEIGRRVVQWGKVRSVPLAVLIFAVLLVVGLASKFGFQYLTAFNSLKAHFPEQTLADYTFIEHLKQRVDTGWLLGRGKGGAPLTGGVVYLVWLIELGCLTYFGASHTTGAAKQPFSEKLGMWANHREVDLVLPITGKEMVDKINAAESVQDLLELPLPTSDTSDQVAVYTVNSIAGEDKEDAYLSVDLQTHSTNAQGEPEVDTERLVILAVLTKAQRELLRQNADDINTAFAAFRASQQVEARSAQVRDGEDEEDE